jgi:hypothetical protein
MIDIDCDLPFSKCVGSRLEIYGHSVPGSHLGQVFPLFYDDRVIAADQIDFAIRRDPFPSKRMGPGHVVKREKGDYLFVIIVKIAG